jgi:hypothetical protein
MTFAFSATQRHFKQRAALALASEVLSRPMERNFAYRACKN